MSQITFYIQCNNYSREETIRGNTVSIFCLDYKLIGFAFKVTLVCFSNFLQFCIPLLYIFLIYVGLKIRECTSNSGPFEGVSSTSISAWHILFYVFLNLTKRPSKLAIVSRCSRLFNITFTLFLSIMIMYRSSICICRPFGQWGRSFFLILRFRRTFSNSFWFWFPYQSQFHIIFLFRLNFHQL